MPIKKSSTPILPIIIILAVIVGGLYFLFKPQQDAPVTAPSSAQEEGLVPSLQTRDIPDSNAEEQSNQPSPGPDEPAPLFRQAPMEAVVIDPCLKATQKLDLFFAYLDEQEYIQQYQFPHDSKEIISGLLNNLLESPPPINGNRLNGTEMIRNSAHIYQTLGRQNLTMLLDIMANEADLMEETSGYFHEWLKISPQCRHFTYPLRPTLEDLYEYAVFFQQTPAGRGYLQRRQDHLRLLAQYYSLLIIHQAEQQGLNKYQVSLASLLTPLISEMEEAETLAGKKTYLAVLYDLRATVL